MPEEPTGQKVRHSSKQQVTAVNSRSRNINDEMNVGTLRGELTSGLLYHFKAPLFSPFIILCGSLLSGFSTFFSLIELQSSLSCSSSLTLYTSGKSSSTHTHLMMLSFLLNVSSGRQMKEDRVDETYLVGDLPERVFCVSRRNYHGRIIQSVNSRNKHTNVILLLCGDELV